MRRLLVLLPLLLLLAVAPSLSLVPLVDGNEVTFTVEGRVKPPDIGRLWVAFVCYEDGVPVSRVDDGDGGGFGPFLIETGDCVGFLYSTRDPGDILAQVSV